VCGTPSYANYLRQQLFDFKSQYRVSHLLADGKWLPQHPRCPGFAALRPNYAPGDLSQRAIGGSRYDVAAIGYIGRGIYINTSETPHLDGNNMYR